MSERRWVPWYTRPFPKVGACAMPSLMFPTPVWLVLPDDGLRGTGLSVAIGTRENCVYAELKISFLYFVCTSIHT